VTGPEHYREAERLAKRADHFTYGDGADPVTGAATAAQAQVHATLALAAATALAASDMATDGNTAGDWRRMLAADTPGKGDGGR
jgi:hypothetical protein